ncbi:uncharacterized protein LOC135848519 [Planococcus citri]|uniref:uncharacterized protein LOC135848519 n=1 Tax=Planococcus citri TaxID=170843 RepID=UPI0031F79DA9
MTIRILFSVIFNIFVISKYAECILLEKESPKSTYGAYITLDAPTFKMLVESSDAIADKTLLISYILSNEDDKVIAITLPRGWGKTINLNMISCFVGIQATAEGYEVPLYNTWSYRFFVKGELYDKKGNLQKFKKRPLISNEKNITSKYLAQYPVIRLDLSEEFPSLNYAGFYEAFIKCIQKAFQEHQYVVARLRRIIDDPNILDIKKESAQKTLTQFVKFSSGDERNETELLSSIVFLSRTLKRQFNKFVFLFIDEYTWPVTNVYLSDYFDEPDEQRITNFYFQFMRITLEKNIYLYRCLLSGVFAIKEKLFTRIPTFNVMDNRTMAYYGFNKTDLDDFFVAFKVPEEKRAQAEQWYLGYTIIDRQEFQSDQKYIDKLKNDIKLGFDLSSLLLYNPYSIVNFLNVFNIRNYWLDSQKFPMFHRSFHYIEMRLVFETLSFSNRAFMQYNDLAFTLQDMRTWRKVMNFDDSWNITDSIDSILAVFVSTGYLTMGEHGKQSVRIPNSEIFSTVLNELEMYYCTTLRYDMQLVPDLINNTAYTLTRFIEEDENVTVGHLVQDFTSVFEEFDQFKYERRMDESENEELMRGKQRALHGIAFMTMLCAKIMFEFKVRPEVSGNGNNYVFYRTIYGAVFEIGSNYRLTNDVIEAKEKNDTEFFEIQKNVKRVKIVRIRVNDTGAVDIYVKKIK